MRSNYYCEEGCWYPRYHAMYLGDRTDENQFAVYKRPPESIFIRINMVKKAA